MKIKYYNCPKPQNLNKTVLPTANFVSYQPDFKLIAGLRHKYRDYKNILVIGHGGSITSFIGIYNALKHQTDKQAYFLNTIDPDYIYDLKQKLNPKDTVVIAASESGKNITQLEALNQFWHYPVLTITNHGSALHKISEQMHATVVFHPGVVTGRYSGTTEVGLLPAGIVGIDVKNIFFGARELYKLYLKNNPAWQVASILFQLEKSGIVDVFMPVYSHNLFPMSNMIIQLCHESFGKNNVGQTYFMHEAPESQHHTNQRFFGGRKNICGFFVGSDSFNNTTSNSYPVNIRNIQVRDHKLSEVDRISLNKAMQFELFGTLQTAKHSDIPVLWQQIKGFESKEIGRFLAFWQLYAVYGSVLRKVNPFDQPAVEASKTLSFKERLS